MITVALRKCLIGFLVLVLALPAFAIAIDPNSSLAASLPSSLLQPAAKAPMHDCHPGKQAVTIDDRTYSKDPHHSHSFGACLLHCFNEMQSPFVVATLSSVQGEKQLSISIPNERSFEIWGLNPSRFILATGPPVYDQPAPRSGIAALFSHNLRLRL